jgi:hypothetical protein
MRWDEPLRERTYEHSYLMPWLILENKGNHYGYSRIKNVNNDNGQLLQAEITAVTTPLPAPDSARSPV